MDADLDNNQNGIRNGEATRFTAANQPSSSAKKRGWERRRVAQHLMDTIIKYQNMPLGKFMEIVGKLDNEESSKKFKMRDILAIRYVHNSYMGDKFLLDWMNRHVPYAPQNVDLTSKDEPIAGFMVKVVRDREELKQRNEMDEHGRHSSLGEE